MTKANLHRSDFCRPREMLSAAEGRAVAIRKLLNNVEQKLGRRDRGVTDDAMQLAESIQKLARFGQLRSAEDAVEIVFRVEVLSSLLEAEVDHILASRR